MDDINKEFEQDIDMFNELIDIGWKETEALEIKENANIKIFFKGL